jgi:hypothetical protein
MGENEMKNENEVWELMDNWFEKMSEKNEAIETCHNCERPTITIKYARISEHKLVQHEFRADMSFMRRLSDFTITAVLNDILRRFRNDES